MHLYMSFHSSILFLKNQIVARGFFLLVKQIWLINSDKLIFFNLNEFFCRFNNSFILYK